MGGKGNDSPPPELQRRLPQAQMGGELDAIMGLFEGMMGMNAGLIKSMQEMSNTNQSVVIPQVPTVFESPEMDWSEQEAKLRAKMTGDQAVKDKQRRNRTSTIHTSPLLDNEDAETTKSLLGS